MGTLRYYAVTPEVAETLKNDESLRIWPQEIATEDGARARALTTPASFLVVTALDGRDLPQGLSLGEIETVKDPPSPPPLRGADESKESYRARFKLDVVRGFAG